MFNYIKFIFKTFTIPIQYCNIIYGRTGAGKSYYMAHNIRKDLFNGLDVDTTLDINADEVKKQFKKTLKYKISKYIKRKPLKLGQLYKISELDDFIFIKSSRVYIDEGHRWFWNRLWEQLPKYIPAKIYEHRKYETSIFIGVQDVKSIDVLLRRLGDNAIQIKSFFFIQFIKFYDIADIDKEKRKSKRLQIIFRKPEIFKIFNSYEKNTDFEKIIKDNNLVDKRIKIL